MSTRPQCQSAILGRQEASVIDLRGFARICIALAVAGCTTSPPPVRSPVASTSVPPIVVIEPTPPPPTPTLSPSPRPEATTAPSASPIASRELRVMLDGAIPRSLVGPWVGYEDGVHAPALIGELLFNTLYEANARLEVIPELAAGLPAYEDEGRTWLVTVRDGVRFHDGSPLTADDVVFSYQLVGSKRCTQNPCAAVREHLLAVSARDERTIAFRLASAHSPFLADVMAQVPILPEDSLRAAWAGLAASSAAVRRSELRDLLERHQLDQEEVCDSPCAPPTVAELETALRAAGAALPNIEEFRDPRDPGSASTAYRFELISRTGALLDGLRETGIDQLLVWLPLLEFAARPVGTGPYRYGAREPATSLELVVNEDYFDGRPLIPRIQLYPMPTHPNSRPAIPVDLVLGGTEGDPRYAIDLPRWSQQSQFSWFLFAFNLRPGSLFVDQRLRQAFALCFDRRDLVSQWVHDGIPTDSFVHPSSWAHDETRLPARDVGRGRQLIEEAGWVPGERGVYEKDGRRLAMDLALNAGRVERVVLAKAAAVQLQDCGMELSVLEADYFFNPVFGLPGTSDVDLIGLPMGFDPDGFDFLHSTRKYDLERVDAGQDLNIPAWSNPEADRLLEEGRTEVDPARRLEIYRRLQEILRDELPYLPLFVRTHPFGLAAHVRAIDGTIDLESPRYAWNIEDWVVEP